MKKNRGNVYFIPKELCLLFSVLVVCLVLAGCSSGTDNQITENTVKDSLTGDLRTYKYADFGESGAGTDHRLNIDGVTIEGQEEENGGQTVYAEIRMSDQVFSVKAYYKLLYRKSGTGWRLDSAAEYKPGEMEIRADPSEEKVRAYYRDKYGDLTLLEMRKDGENHVFRYQFAFDHAYLTIRGTIEVAARPGKANREAVWLADVAETERDLEWKVEGKWCYYFSCTPETYGKSAYFSDSRYVYTIWKENGQYVFTVDRYQCESGGTEKLAATKTGVAVIRAGDKPELTCSNDFTFTNLCFGMDDVRQTGVGLNDPVYPAK